MKKFLCVILALSLLLAFAACVAETGESTDQPTQTVQDTEPSSQTQLQGTVENSVSYFSMSIGDSLEFRNLTAYDNEDGTAYVEYVGEEKKVGNLDSSVLAGITVELGKTTLAALHEKSEYTDGDAYASMYIQYADGSYLMADFGGSVPQEFTEGYDIMEAYFQGLTEEMSAYVPQPAIMGDVNEELLAAILEILNASGVAALDGFSISDVPMDENFGYVTGLSSADGIVSAAACTPMMMTTAYSLVIVTAEEADSIDDICEDFASSMDWRKWVCVAPSNALIAQKGNMVLCLMGSDELFQQTAAAAEGAGWTNVQTLENPDH